MTEQKIRHWYFKHKHGAKCRGIEFKLTFEEWRAIWGDKIAERGRRSWQLGMCRIGDKGAYEVGNVYLATPRRNGASRRMANENRNGANSRYCHFAGSSGRTVGPESPEDRAGRTTGYSRGGIW